MDILHYAILGRIIERLLIVIGAIICLWIGGKLFSFSTSSDHTAEFSFKDVMIKLQKISPGILFAGFGAGILVFSIISPLTIKNPGNINNISDSGTISYFQSGASKAELDRLIAATNSISNISSIPIETNITIPDRKLLRSSKEALLDIQYHLYNLRFSAQQLKTWDKWKNLDNHQSDNLSVSEKKTIKLIQKTKQLSFVKYAE